MIILCTPISQLLPVKNVEGVLRAVSQDKNFFVNIVGGGDDSKLKKLAKELNIEDRMKFWGMLSNKKAREVLRNSDVFVLNSFHEGMPHALIEALAEGIPVVATRIPAHEEILTDKINGVLVNISDAKDLVEKIWYAKKLRAKLIINGKKLYQEKFTWKVHLKHLYCIFYSIS